MKKNVVKGLLGTAVLVGLGVGTYFLFKDDKESVIPNLDEDDNLFDQDIADDFDKEEKESVEFETDVKKVFDTNEKVEPDNVSDVKDNYIDMELVGEPSDYENEFFMRFCAVSREDAIKFILEKMPQYKEEELVKKINSELAHIYFLTKKEDKE